MFGTHYPNKIILPTEFLTLKNEVNNAPIAKVRKQNLILVYQIPSTVDIM
jgi:hypothetical protein